MLHKCSLAGSLAIMIAMLSVPAWADIIQDPTAGVEADNFSVAISTFTGQIDPTANGGVFGLFNDTGATITALFLHSFINPGLTAADISSSFTCNSGTNSVLANPFFLHCGFDYVSSTGAFTISFSGVNPQDGDETSSDTEIGEREGIPTAGNCLPPASTNCNAAVGHFSFVFNNNFQNPGTPGVTNGWGPGMRSTANPNTVLFNVTPLFDHPGFTVVPEPGSLLLLGGGIFALAGLSRRRAREQRIARL